MNKIKFADMTREQRLAMNDEEWTAVPPEEKRSCHDCRHLKAVINLWCMNEEAAKARGTRIPGVCLCSFWEPIIKKKKRCGFLK